MPESAFKITSTPPISLTLAVDEPGTFSFTVTCLAAPDVTEEVVAQALLVGPGGKTKVDWAVAQPRGLTLSGGESATVAINLRPSASTPQGEAAIVLAIADKAKLNDEVSYSSPVTCKVVATRQEATPPPPRSPWLIPLVIGCAVALAGAAFAMWRTIKLAGAVDEARAALVRAESGVTEAKAGVTQVDTAVGEVRKRLLDVETGTVALGESLPNPANICPNDSSGIRGARNQRVAFATRFAAPPKVVVGLSQIDYYTGQNLRIHAGVTAVDATGFSYEITTWCDTRIASAQVVWAAFGTR